MNTILLLGVGWTGEPSSDARYLLASILAFILTLAFVLLFKRTVGRSAGLKGPRTALSSRRDGYRPD